MASLLENTLNHALGGLSVTPEGKLMIRKLVGRVLLACRWFVRLCAGGYLLFLALLCLLFRTIGEQNLTLAFGLYLPPAGWGLPLLAIAPLALIFDWKSFPLLVAGIAFIAFGLFGLEWHSPRAAPGNAPVLTVLTFNRGESVGSLQPFKNATQPDVILLQDANDRANRYIKSPGYEEFGFGDNIGQFTIVSRFPVTSKELIVDGGVAVAGRFTIDWQGRSVALYTMHLPTPRDPLRSLFRGAFMWGLPGPWSGKRAAYQPWWNAHIEHSEAIIKRAQAEMLPCIVAGDSNAPAQGYVHHLYTRTLIDSHEAAGFGCGMSFPGTTHNPLSLGGPWMRIDKILCNSAWLPLWNKAEAERPSQHRAVAAAFALPVK